MNRKDSIGRWLAIINGCLKSYVSKQLEPYNLGSGQFHYILLLYKHDGITQEEMTKYTNKDKGTTARAIKKLEREGYVTRKVNPEDKRSYKIYLTQKVINMKPIIFNVLDKSIELLEQGLSNEEKDMLLIVLKKMAKNAVKNMKEN
ncbi:MarR family winged helix-turn-helix transcriptional regulator [Caldisalinibacter kiritimatiensis]|uniref:Transcriptional regulator, MarR family n=1 Tax=Caldisalinibacter kiritimatiensis TaxID=1304284 RepID=R1CGT8_9FIRM|nr:MarR family transcriptional regulator [Caldisalinibacter kiritimatiensis]EOD01495.1 Transcriptional regulator, MarR family [Caldisalinibacter kiritimatiensis]